MAALGIKAIDQNDFPTRTNDARAFGQYLLGPDAHELSYSDGFFDCTVAQFVITLVAHNPEFLEVRIAC
jgi:hypothetical protein